MNASQIEKLQEIGKTWTNDDGSKQRIYFSGLAEWAGLKANYYNSGNIQSASFRGETISNSEARSIREKYSDLRCKIWFDLNTEKFDSRGFDKLPKSLSYIIEQIEKAIAS